MPLLLSASFSGTLSSALHAGALGSPGFISPEIILGEPHTYAMDVFAVGVIIFVILVGRKPFNIADSESLSYVHMNLHQCPGMQDPRYISLVVHANFVTQSCLLLRALVPEHRAAVIHHAFSVSGDHKQ